MTQQGCSQAPAKAAHEGDRPTLIQKFGTFLNIQRLE